MATISCPPSTNYCSCCSVKCSTLFLILPIEITFTWHTEGFAQVHTGSSFRSVDWPQVCSGEAERQGVYRKHSLALNCSYFLPAVWQLRSWSNCFQAEKCGTVSPNEIIAWGKDFFEAGRNVITQVGLLPGQWCLKHFQLLWKVPQDLLMTAKEWALEFIFLIFFFFCLSISSKRQDNKMRKKKLSKKELIFAKCWNM